MGGRAQHEVTSEKEKDRRDRERQTDRERERQRDRQRDRERQRQRDIERRGYESEWKLTFGRNQCGSGRTAA